MWSSCLYFCVMVTRYSSFWVFQIKVLQTSLPLCFEIYVSFWPANQVRGNSQQHEMSISLCCQVFCPTNSKEQRFPEVTLSRLHEDETPKTDKANSALPCAAISRYCNLHHSPFTALSLRARLLLEDFDCWRCFGFNSYIYLQVEISGCQCWIQPAWCLGPTFSSKQELFMHEKWPATAISTAGKCIA